MFWKRKTEEKLKVIDYSIRASFLKVKNDTQTIHKWLYYLYKKSIYQEQVIQSLKEELSWIPKRPEDIKKIIDHYYSYEEISNKLSHINHRIDGIIELQNKEKQNSVPLVKNSQSQERLSEDTTIDYISKRLKKLEQAKMSMREKLMKRLTKNSKEYIKGMLVGYIKKYGSITATQLKDMVVEEQGLCSKSSFYRMLEEVELDENIGVMRQGKEKHYLYKIKNF